VGAKDPRKDYHGKTDFRLARQLRNYKINDKPPTRVKPVPITLVLYILRLAFSGPTSDYMRIVARIICIAFYFLLRPGEYTGTKTDDQPFLIQDITLHLGTRPLDSYEAPIEQIKAATAVTYTFTTQKNANRNEQVSHGRSKHVHCCPVKTTIDMILYHRKMKTPKNKPLASYYNDKNKLIPIAAADITERLRFAARANFHLTGIADKDISARSLRAGGAMALMCGNIDFDIIKLLGRWQSDAMLRYLHVQAQPVTQQLAVKMFNNGKYSFAPTDTVPLAQ
jgi:hypothetical protein